MTNDNSNSPPPGLNLMLAQALDRSVETSLDSLAALRSAVRAYTLSERNRGMSLESVMRAVSGVLMEIEDDRKTELNAVPVRDPDLARKLRAWCGTDYSEGA